MDPDRRAPRREHAERAGGRFGDSAARLRTISKRRVAGSRPEPRERFWRRIKGPARAGNLDIIAAPKERSCIPNLTAPL